MSDKSVIAITWASKNAGTLDLLKEQLAAAGIPFVVNPGGMWYANTETTLARFREMAERYSDYERIVFCDAFDVLFFGNKTGLRIKLPELLIAAERNCYPDQHLAELLPETGTPWRYVNGGLVAGSPARIIEWCAEIEAQPEYARIGRRLLNQQYFNLLRVSTPGLIPLDSAARVFYCMQGEAGELGYSQSSRDRRPYNRVASAWPNFVHFNGNWPMHDFMAGLSGEAPHDPATAGNLEVKREVFEKKRLLICTPMYGGNAAGAFQMQCLNLQHRLVEAGVTHSFRHIYAESLVPRARNKFASEFLAEQHWTHLLFLDGDIVFTPDDVLHLLAIDKPVIGAPYAKKAFDWEKIKRALLADPEMPAEHLPMVGCAPVLKWKANGTISLAQAQQVESLGTGLLLIERAVFEQLSRRYPALEYRPMMDEPQRPTYDFFGVGKNPDEPHNYLSEDYWFERLWRAMGGEVWVCPWMVTRHIGSQEYPCDLAISARYNKSV